MNPKSMTAVRTRQIHPRHHSTVVVPRHSRFELALIRLVDVLGASMLLLVLALPMLLLSLLIKLTSPGGAFYQQERTGRGGKPFVMFKFRTMRLGAEDHTGPVWARQGDPRRTWIGVALRRLSIDELPQFVNVLRGDMSLVGPRPERPYFVSEFSKKLPAYNQRHQVRPGITGWAQINGWRGDSSIEKRLEHDFYYVQHRSLLFNLRILLLTPIRVFFEQNACEWFAMEVQPVRSLKGLALALLIAAACQGILAFRSATISADGILFVEIARNLTSDPLATLRHYDQHPGYPAMLLACTRAVQALGVSGEPEAWVWGGQLAAYLCGLVSVAIVWFFARDLFDTGIANLAALTFAILPIPRLSAADALSDTPHLMFYLLAAWLATSAVTTGRPWRLAGAGASSALAYWIRPEGLEVAVVALACLLLQSYLAAWPWRRTVVACTALSTAALLVAAPYPILAQKITSKQLPFAKQEAVPTFISDQARREAEVAASQPQPAPPPAAPAAAQPVAAPRAPSSVADTSATLPAPDAPPPAAPPEKKGYRLGLVLKLLGKGTAQFAVSACQGFKFAFVPLYWLSFVALVHRNPGGMRIAFVSLLGAAHFVILLGVFILSGYVAHRHTLPVVALAMPFTGLGIFYAGELLARWIKVEPRYLAMGVLAVCGAVIVPFDFRAYNREFSPVIAATHWVHRQAAPGVGIVSNSPYVDFYGTLPTALLNYITPTLETALAKAKTPARYEYVVLHVGAHDYRPDWIAQLEPHYRQVALFPDPWSERRPKKVLVFQAKDSQAQRLLGGPRS